MFTVFLGLGSNLGNRLSNLHQAALALEENPDLEVLGLSPIYETEPVGVSTPQPPYYNAVLEIKTPLFPMQLLHLTKDIERQRGRRQKETKESRYLDLDLLAYLGILMNTPLLTLPHPLLAERWFVLVPLDDLHPELILPGCHLSVSECLQELGTPQGITLIQEEFSFEKASPEEKVSDKENISLEEKIPWPEIFSSRWVAPQRKL